MPQRNQINIPSEILRTLITIDALGSLTKAARQLGLSQPAISFQVKKLSAIVGGPVFDATTGSKVTPLGKLVLTQAKKFIQANDQILALGGATAKDQPLRLGLPSLYARDFLAAWERSGSREEILVNAAYSTSVLALFTEGNLDVLCVPGRQPELGQSVMAWEETLAWIRAPDFVLPIGKPIPIIGLPGSVRDQTMIAALEKASLSYRMTFSSADTEARYAAVTAKYGITVLPERFVPANLTIATEYYLPKLPPVLVSVLVSPDCDINRAEALLRTLKELVPA